MQNVLILIADILKMKYTVCCLALSAKSLDKSVSDMTCLTSSVYS